ncbi:MAG: GGDEF domain-containing protein [Lachnospiraceae bacterium]|nr:GGDEF domain-containing protein [Lachnospiraceae bacterium]
MEDTLQNKADMSNRMACIYEDNIVIVYDCKAKRFIYPKSIEKYFPASFDERPLWQIMLEDNVTSERTAMLFEQKIKTMSQADTPQAYFAECLIRNTRNIWKWYRVGVVCPVLGETLTITVTDIDKEVALNYRLEQMSEYDEMTGLFNRNAFVRRVEIFAQKDKKGMQEGKYALIYFDILRFKAVNDMFGMKEGDRLLKYIANRALESVGNADMVCRLGSDKFMIFIRTEGRDLQTFVENVSNKITDYDLPFKLICNIGVYVTNEGVVSANTMIDRAVLAQSAIKGSYTKRYNFYTESLRKDMLSEQEIAGMMVSALAEKQFVVYYQPQYNHSTGTLVGAEALVRWNHPERGLISPGIFIPIFEKNGFITQLDLYVFEQCCRFVKERLDRGESTVPVSSNFSRYDIFQPDFVEKLEEIRKAYDVPVKYLRVEITESVAVGGSAHVNDVVKRLHSCGYIVEMDDFGSGYSSLNVLKDIDLDMIKLDMLFMSEASESNRGGTILSSVVRMAKWLQMPVIAEGVETAEQADFLHSIGCNYIQGYLYSKPLPEAEYKELLNTSTIEIAEKSDSGE